MRGALAGAGRKARATEFLGSEPFFVDLDRFSGPLDLLLHLIRSQDIDIFDIPIARITAQFQAVLDDGIEKLELDRAGEFLEMAATLVRIKVQLLLPRSGELEWEDDPRAELVRRLLEYEHFQEVAHLMAQAENDRSRHLGKGYVEPRTPPPTLERELEFGSIDFFEAAKRIFERAADRVHRASVRGVTVAEKIGLLRGLLRKSRRVSFDKLFAPWGTRPHAVASLLACLELARRQAIRIEQTSVFGAIFVLRRKNSKEMVQEET